MTEQPNPLVVAAGRANGKITLFFDRLAGDRYEAAIRYEQACQHVRECDRFGIRVSARAAQEVREARAAYDRITAALAAAEAAGAPRIGRHRHANA